MSTSPQTDAGPAITASGLGEALLGSSSDAIVATDAEGIIRFWNPGAARVFGHTSNEAIGQSLDIIIPERLRERHWAGYRQVMATGESRYGHGDVLAVPGIRKDGAPVSLEFTIVSLRDGDGAMIGMAAVMRDVTARFEEMRMLRQKLAQAQRWGGKAS